MLLLWHFQYKGRKAKMSFYFPSPDMNVSLIYIESTICIAWYNDWTHLMLWERICAQIKNSIASMFLCSDSSPRDVDWTKFIYSPIDVSHESWLKSRSFGELFYRKMRPSRITFTELLVLFFIFQGSLLSTFRKNLPIFSREYFSFQLKPFASRAGLSLRVLSS